MNAGPQHGGRERIGLGRTAEIYAWGSGRVLKLFLDWCPASWVDYEAQVARAVHATGMPSPAVLDVVEVDGRRGIVYERVDGVSMLSEFRSKLWRLAGLGRLLAELHAQMHGRSQARMPAERPGLPSLRERLERKIGEAKPLPETLKEGALRALARLPEGDSLCHGDFHPENVLMTARGPVVIDWTDATIGNPLADVARTSLLLQSSTLPPEMPASTRLLLKAIRSRFHSIYLKRYLQLRPASRAELAAWRLPVAAARLSEGIKEEEGRLLAIIEAGLKRDA